MALVPRNQVPAPNNQPFRWTIPAAMQLVRERRALQGRFDAAATTNHDGLWTIVSASLFAAVGFVATPHQCRTKWNALVNGYRNLRRIYTQNPQRFPLSSPNSFDIGLFTEMSDEFWKRTGN